jgi:hypothetical protein
MVNTSACCIFYAFLQKERPHKDLSTSWGHKEMGETAGPEFMAEWRR